MDQVIDRILRLSDPRQALERKVQVRNNELVVEGSRFQFSKPLVISVGKASVKMANFFLEKLSNYEAIVVKPKGDNLTVEGHAQIIHSSHPYPDDESFRAGKLVREALMTWDYDLVIFLLSGGASSLMEDPIPPAQLYVETMKKLVTSGLGIDEINTVRKHLSRVKGGRLASLARSQVVTLVVSDVPGNDLSVVGSGPTIQDPSTVDEARQILEQLNLDLVQYLEETPKQLSNSWVFLIQSVSDVLKDLTDMPGAVILSSEVRGEARSLGSLLASIVNTRELSFRRPFTILLGGEPEVTVRGPAGKGGRNGEVCLSFLEWVKVTNVTLYAVATDGIDGNSEYAGCVVSGGMDVPKREIRKALETHSSYELLERIGAVIKTGPTGTNVNNVYVLIAP
ncbi:glycerate 2-kinase [Metallosphaera sedula]|uniref:Glycerate 2-kinase n=3 Tax=Metallosphaera TaxID=41980 RepID=A4YIA1_METS5|nr:MULTISPECIES: glycerate 2-kinase [Metallosphaera]ABP96153.1 glycerate 2-kinase [Metallosphaera sedula DSM 5348]AIM28136.1 glycerate 2-kinase [Metallosphaera sedula]AKV74960.1 glycerate kinase [Metallosphaera sedula]AKV77198.1 glycerate kinase [Metallosphaera sedula]AKV79448.1 glycerate kinase [Metallosphaera sedula]